MDNQYFFLLLMAIDMCDWFLFSESQLFGCVGLNFFICLFVAFISQSI